jgi:glycosyltransferase involved in cell wall biosynthesis
MPKYTIIIPYWNRERHLRRTLEALREQTFKDFEVVIVGQKVESEFRSVEVKDPNNYSDPTSIRLGKILNAGFDNSRGEYIQFLQADLIIKRDYLEVLCRHAAPGRLVCGKVLEEDGRLGRPQKFRCDRKIARFDYADGLDGCIHRRDFEPVSEEFEGIQSHLYVEWLERLWLKGIEFIYVPELRSIHQCHPLPPDSMEQCARSKRVWMTMKSSMGPRR